MFKKPVILLFALIFFPRIGLASRVINLDMSDVIKDAAVVVVADVEKVEKKPERCESTTIATLKPVTVLKGKLRGGLPVQFIYTIHFFIGSDKPGEPACPSVHYYQSPVAENLKEGQQVIASIIKDPYTQEYRYNVTGTFDMDKLEEIKKLIRK